MSLAYRETGTQTEREIKVFQKEEKERYIERKRQRQTDRKTERERKRMDFGVKL